MYLQPKKDVKLTLDTEQFDETITYSGEGATPNNYLAKHYMLRETEMGERYAWETNLKPNEYKAKVTALRDKELALLKSMKPTLPAQFYKDQQYESQYNWASSLNLYPVIHAHFTKTDKAEMDSDYMSYTKEVSINNPDALNSPAYRNYLLNKIQKGASEQLTEDSSSEDYYLAILSESKKFDEGKLKNYLLANALQDMVNASKAHIAKKDLEDFLKAKSTKEYHAGMQALIDTWAALGKGRPAPNFTFTTLDGKETSLAAYKGKVVYLDFWASWCGPCLGEMPHSKTLKEKFAGNPDVVFLYVSIDDDEKAWRSMIEKKNIEGEHGWSQGWSSPAPVAYNVNYIPRYVLIGKDGTILDANTSRPSSEETATNISEALALP
jgi:thiol-disulfide isomerase/thioredoxin